MSDYVSVDQNVYTHVGYSKLKGRLETGETTLLEVLQYRVASDPEMGIFGTIGRNDEINYVTYKTLDRKARSLGVYLESITKEKDTVGIFSINRPEWLVAEYGTYYASCANLPIHATYTPETISKLIMNTKLDVIIASGEMAEVLLTKIIDQCTEHRFKMIIVMDESPVVEELCRSKDVQMAVLSEILKNEDGKPSRMPPKHSDLATICFTSGTSGEPKGVELTHGNFIAQLEAFDLASKFYEVFRVEDDCYFSYLPLAHVLERICLLICFSHGARVVFYRGDYKNLVDDFKLVKPTFITVVPKVLQRFHDTIEMKVKEKKWYLRAIFYAGMAYKTFMQRFGVYRSWFWDFLVFRSISDAFGGSIRACLCGGASVSPEVVRYMQAIWSGKIFEGYGQTEGIGANILDLFTSVDAGTVGIPFVSTQIKLVDLPDDYPADQKLLYMRGPAISRGYYGGKHLSTDPNSDDSWLDTGDIVRVGKNMKFYIVGRYKDMIKLGNGEYVSPEYIETEMKDHLHDIENMHITIIPGKIDLVVMAVCKNNSMDTTEIAGKMKSALRTLINSGKINKYVSFHHFVLLRKDFHEIESEHPLVTAAMKKRRTFIDLHFKKEIEEAYKTRY